MIPAERFSPAAADQLLQYLVEELDRAQGDRRELEEQWMRFQRLYRAEPATKHKTFPFDGCSNLEIGLIGTDVDIVASRLLAMIFTPPSLWSTTASRPEMQDFAPRLGEMLQWAQDHEIKPYAAVRDWVYEICKLGTGILKTRYHRESKKVYEFREVADPMSGRVQTIQQQVVRMVQDSPKIHHVSLFDFYVPGTAVELQSAPWCSERLNLTWPQLVNRARAGIYTNVDKVQPYRGESRGSQYEQYMQGLDKFTPSLGDKYEFFESWLDWDIDGDGEQEAVVATIHKLSRTMVRLDLNPFFNQEKPYDVGRYLAQEKRFYGIGLCEMLDPYQTEVSTMHNQRIDNKTLANAMVIIAQRNGSIKQNEPIYPGRILLVDDVQNEVRMEQFGTVTDSTIQDEAATIALARQRTGVNDYIAGSTDNASAGYAAATTAVQQLKEGAKRFDQVYREIRQPLANTGLRVTELYQQFNQGGKLYQALGPKDGQMVMQILSFPLELIRSGVGVEVTATSAAFNKEVEIRTNTIVMQMLTQFYGQLLQVSQIVLNPQLPPMMRLIGAKAMQGGVTLMERILDDYGIQDSDKMLPDLTELFGGQQQQTIPGAGFAGAFGAPQQAGFGPGPVGAFPGAAPGMGALPPGAFGAPGLLPAQAGNGFGQR